MHMKKSILTLLSVLIFLGTPVNAQVGRFLNKVSKSVANKVDGKPETGSKTSNQEPEPKCACDHPDLALIWGEDLN